MRKDYTLREITDIMKKIIRADDSVLCRIENQIRNFSDDIYLMLFHYSRYSKEKLSLSEKLKLLDELHTASLLQKSVHRYRVKSDVSISAIHCFYLFLIMPNYSNEEVIKFYLDNVDLYKNGLLSTQSPMLKKDSRSGLKLTNKIKDHSISIKENNKYLDLIYDSNPIIFLKKIKKEEITINEEDKKYLIDDYETTPKNIINVFKIISYEDHIKVKYKNGVIWLWIKDSFIINKDFKYKEILDYLNEINENISFIIEPEKPRQEILKEIETMNEKDKNIYISKINAESYKKVIKKSKFDSVFTIDMKRNFSILVLKLLNILFFKTGILFFWLKKSLIKGASLVNYVEILNEKRMGLNIEIEEILKLKNHIEKNEIKESKDRLIDIKDLELFYLETKI